MKKNDNYSHAQIERKWQKAWETQAIYTAKRDPKKKKFFGLIEFPYPSGSGLHVGHVRSNTAMDVIARKRRMEGFNVLYPIGWDAFGLPTENYAIKTGIAPAKVTKTNTDIFRKQLKSIGFSFDWSREVNTTDPAYFKWTQWIFLQMYKKGLAYKAKTEINWCTSCKIGLANEEVVGGVCERCGGKVEKRQKEQWMLAITKYADRLDRDLDTVDYLEKIKIQQRNWIGKSEGSEINFKLSTGDSVPVFTTRADTLFGATYIVLAPENQLVSQLKASVKNWDDVETYIRKVKDTSEEDRTNDKKEKTGVCLEGIFAINPATNEQIPVWIADYVLNSYGTGAVMAVPAHDERDLAFAKKYNLPKKIVIVSAHSESLDPGNKDEFLQILYALLESGDAFGKKNFFTDGVLIDSGIFSGMASAEARKKVTEAIGGKIVTKYKLRDWVFSRQRYWGEPIPIIHCEKCGYVPVPEKELPVLLPKVKSYVPTDTGESPLALIHSWVNTKCPTCRGPARRETDTMPNWAGSSWYYLRYTDPTNKKELASKENLAYFMKNGVDWYNGGMEHTTLHLLYSRFWHKFLYDLKVVPTSEPYHKRTSHGMILAESGDKMSKSKGNVVNPDEIVKTYGADTLRVYEMFMGPFDQSVAWSTASMMGPRKFLERVWKLTQRSILVSPKAKTTKELEKLLHKTIKKVTEDIETMGFNTAISAMMIFLNEAEKSEPLAHKDAKLFLKILAPFAPHMTEELWDQFGEKNFIHTEDWPKYTQKLIIDDHVKIAIQVNGKVRDEIEIEIDADEESVKKEALARTKVLQFTDGKQIKKVIYVKGRLVSIVV